MKYFHDRPSNSPAQINSWAVQIVQLEVELFQILIAQRSALFYDN